MFRSRHRCLRAAPVLVACVLAVSLTGSAAFAQSSGSGTMKPKAGAGSTTGVGNSPIIGSGETGNGRVLTGTGGSGASPLPGTRDPSSTTGPAGTGGTSADPISPKTP